jgi:predicted peroxiredoxin
LMLGAALGIASLFLWMSLSSTIIEEYRPHCATRSFTGKSISDWVLEVVMIRRQIFSRLSQTLGVGFLASRAMAEQASGASKKLKILMRSSWGTDEPTRASFPFAHALVLSDAGHEVQIFLTADATSLMRKATTDAIFPIGWPPLSELRDKIVAKHIPVFSCGACSRARAITEADLQHWGAKFGSPPIFVSLVEWADRIVTE